MAKTHEIVSFEVEGKYPFPMDMLRYDQCWPATSDDAAKIGYTYNGERQSQRIRLNAAVHASFKYATIDRWASFGWTVIRNDY